MGAGEGDGGDHVVGVRRTDDDGRAVAVGGLEAGAFGVVAVVAGEQDGAVDLPYEGVRQLLQFSDSLEVMHPPEARRVLARAAASLGEIYGGEGTGA